MNINELIDILNIGSLLRGIGATYTSSKLGKIQNNTHRFLASAKARVFTSS